MIKYLVAAAIIAFVAFSAVESADIEGKVSQRTELLNNL